MFGWFRKLRGGGTAASRQRNNPCVDAAVQESARIYSRIPLAEYIDEQRRARLARELFLEINRICNARDPITTCREALASALLLYASYQVLVIPPAPQADPSGLRGQPGISGELRDRLADLLVKDNDLRSVAFRETGSNESGAMDRVLDRLYWESAWLLETTNATRIALGDMPDSGQDWFPAFVYAQCAKQEHDYRWMLEMPPAFPAGIAREASTACAVFTDIVISGAADPVAEWRDYCAGAGVELPEIDA